MHSVKNRAKNLKQQLATTNIVISHSQALELVAQMDGYPSWNHYAAHLNKTTASFEVDVVQKTTRAGYTWVWMFHALTRLQSRPQEYALVVTPFPISMSPLWEDKVCPCPLDGGESPSVFQKALKNAKGKIVVVSPRTPSAVAPVHQWFHKVAKIVGAARAPVQTYLLDPDFATQDALGLAQTWRPITQSLCVFTSHLHNLEDAPFVVRAHLVEAENVVIDSTLYTATPNKLIPAETLNTIGGWLAVRQQSLHHAVVFSGAHPSIDLFNDFLCWSSQQWMKTNV